MDACNYCINRVVPGLYPCNNKFELLQRERYYIDLLKPQLNNNLPTRTTKQYKIDNAETYKQQQKQYNAQYRIDNADIAKQYRIDHKETKTQYNAQYKIKQKNIKFIKHMADFMASHQPKHYYLQKFDIFSTLT